MLTARRHRAAVAVPTGDALLSRYICSFNYTRAVGTTLAHHPIVVSKRISLCSEHICFLMKGLKTHCYACSTLPSIATGELLHPLSCYFDAHLSYCWVSVGIRLFPPIIKMNAELRTAKGDSGALSLGKSSRETFAATAPSGLRNPPFPDQ